MHSLMELARARITAAGNGLSPLRASGLNDAPAADGGVSSSQPMSPHAAAAASRDTSLFSLVSAARFTDVAEVTIERYPVQGSLEQFRTPEFVSSQLLGRLLHALAPTAPATPVAAAAASVRGKAAGRSTAPAPAPPPLLVLDVLSWEKTSDGAQQIGANDFRTYFAVRVRVGRVRSGGGVAFGTVEDYPYLGAVRVRLAPPPPSDHGAEEEPAASEPVRLLARCLDKDPIVKDAWVLVTIEPGCIRVQRGRAGEAPGTWQRTTTGGVDAPATDDATDAAEAGAAEAGEGGADGDLGSSPQSVRLGAGRWRSRPRQPERVTLKFEKSEEIIAERKASRKRTRE